MEARVKSPARFLQPFGMSMMLWRRDWDARKKSAHRLPPAVRRRAMWHLADEWDAVMVQPFADRFKSLEVL